MVSDLAYRNLALRGDYDGRRANVSSLTLNAYGGAIAARGNAVIAAPRPFQANLNLTNIDLQQALTGLKAKAANTVRGSLTGQINAAGSGGNFDQIKPTLRGNGRLQINNGKLIGVNVVASALRNVSGIPVINTLLTPSIVARHPATFNSPDTDLKVARLSYVMTGPRMTTNDLTVVSDDYRMLGSGWFDLDRNVDLSLHLLMSRQFSADLQAEKKNVVYLEDPSGRNRNPADCPRRAAPSVRTTRRPIPGPARRHPRGRAARRQAAQQVPGRQQGRRQIPRRRRYRPVRRRQCAEQPDRAVGESVSLRSSALNRQRALPPSRRLQYAEGSRQISFETEDKPS